MCYSGSHKEEQEKKPKSVVTLAIDSSNYKENLGILFFKGKKDPNIKHFTS